MARILVVEDTPDNLRLFRTILGRRGHAILELTSGERLLEVARDAKPDLVLLDIQLPGRDGYQLLADIRGSDQAAMKVVALTAHAYDADRDRAMAAGFDGYITKPIDVRDFSREVEQYL